MMMIRGGRGIVEGGGIVRRWSSSNQGQISTKPFDIKKQWFDIDSVSTYTLLRNSISKATDQVIKESGGNGSGSGNSEEGNITFQPAFNSITSPKIPGDYSISNIFQLSRSLKQTPEELATKLSSIIQDRLIDNDKSSLFSKSDVVNKHVNLTLSQAYLEECVKLWCGKRSPLTYYTLNNTASSKNILVDFASPNMSKELHVGHLRSIALGDSVCRILEYRGHNVERISHVGDFGTPMGMVISHALDEKAPFLQHIWDKSSGLTEMPYIPTAKEMSVYYAAGKARTKTDKEFEKRAQLTAAELQKGPPSQEGTGSNPEIYQAWLDICRASRQGFNRIYEIMGVSVNERGESYYREMLEDVITELRQKGMVSESEGAQCIFLKGSKTPVIIKKRDGAYLYATTDLAAVKSRVASGKDWVVVITDDSQDRHFQEVFEIARLAGWLKEDGKVRVDHLSFGVVRDESGSKLSSRDGNPLSLLELVEEAIARAKQASITSRSLSRAETLDATHTAYRVVEPERVSNRFENDDSQHHFTKIGIGAIKYYDLVQRRNSYKFSYNNILSFKGNTSIYLNYSLTRISTILGRAKHFSIEQQSDIVDSVAFQTFTPNERSLVLMISKFADTMRTAESQIKPAIICDYLWDVADTFHRFYESDTVIGSDREHQRLLICLAVKRILETGFHILGVQPVERM